MKNNNKEFALLRTALWGYSTFMLLFLTLFTLIPTGSSSDSAQDPVAGIFSLSPIAIFLIVIIIEYKKYKWNVWRVILYVYSCILTGIFTLAIFYVTQISSQIGASQESSSSFVGFLYLPVLVYFIILGYEKFS